MSDHKNSKSNYDRWKPGTKLACMMSLKQVCQDSRYYDPSNNRFNSLTWHTVAENLNKEYPDYAKRFTNINVKDRYDRVLKHHKVFKKMADKANGFVWNPKNFCFDLNEELIKQYEEGYIKDDVISNELNVVKFLSKPGHIDLEYYHRFVYQFANQEELENDAIIQSPSFIDDAIAKGILNLVTKSNFVSKNDHQNSNEFQSSPVMLQQQPVQHQSSSSSNTTNSSTSIPMAPNSANSQTQIPNSSMPSQSSSSMIPIQQPHPQHHLIPNPQPPHPSIQPQHSSDLDFSGLINPDQSVPQQPPHTHPHPTPMMNPGMTIPFQMGPGGEMIPGPNTQRNSLPLAGQPPFKKPRTASIPGGSSSVVPQSIIGTAMMVDNYESMLAAQQGPAGGQPAGRFGYSSWEAIMQLNKEFDMMRNLVNEQILNLRLQKLISYQNFNQIQTIQNSNDQFVRSAYKRIGDDPKLIDLINIYLNNTD